MPSKFEIATAAVYKARWVTGMKTIATDADIAQAVLMAIIEPSFTWESAE